MRLYFAFTLILFSILGFTRLELEYHELDYLREGFKIDKDNIPYTQIASLKDIDAAIEMGAMLFSDGRLGAFGNTSCESSCHVKGNHLAPQGNQIALGSYKDHDGIRKKQNYLPVGWVTDAPKINSPQAENLVFRKRVLHNCITTPMGQASEMFGLFAHNLDWTSLINDEVYQNYSKEAFGDTRITERRVSQALVTFQEDCVSSNNNFQDWADGKEMSNSFYRWLELMNDNCFGCHSGRDLGGGGLVMSKPVYKYGTDISFLKSKTVAVRSLYNNDAFDKYGWVGSYVTLSGFLNKHYRNEEIYLKDAEKRRILKGLKRHLND